MLTRSLFLVWAITALSPAAVRCEVLSDPSQLVCANLDSPDVEACVAKQGELAAKKLTPVYKATVAASEQACFELPSPTISACLEKALGEADHALNDAYKRSSAYIDASTLKPADAKEWKAQLKAAQERWIAFRDADCGDLTESEFMQGTGAGAAIEQCLLSKTLMRAEEIRNRYQDR